MWWAFALHYQLRASRPLKWLAILLWLAVAASVAAAVLRGEWRALALFALAWLGLWAWWRRIAPSNDREWADDVAQMLSGTVEGDTVTLRNVRNFDWRGRADYTPRWETRRYDLGRLSSVDLIVSHWGIPAVAHTLVSFGFEDGGHVAFSVEIRRERGEAFSELGGFFKQFEMSVVAADERDIIRVRTNIRGEDDYLYRVMLSADTMRSLFLAYVDEANRLVDAPRFYNTATANCTTIVYHMMTRIVSGLPMDYRLVLSGLLPSYVYDRGGLVPGVSFATLRERGRITERARRADADPDFSARIREGVPGVA